jgi:hypothetical protein
LEQKWRIAYAIWVARGNQTKGCGPSEINSSQKEAIRNNILHFIEGSEERFGCPLANAYARATEM